MDIFVEFESGGVAISCIVFCADQFEILRRTCGCDSTVIESLARCLKWDALGGKSGSAFLKTRGMGCCCLKSHEIPADSLSDDRFIAKELSKSELDAMTNFAPAYFDYMSNAISSNVGVLLCRCSPKYTDNASVQRPTLLAKIFGVYKIAYKNPMLGKTVRMNLMVMENLFYGRRFSRVCF